MPTRYRLRFECVKQYIPKYKPEQHFDECKTWAEDTITQVLERLGVLYQDDYHGKPYAVIPKMLMPKNRLSKVKVLKPMSALFTIEDGDYTTRVEQTHDYYFWSDSDPSEWLEPLLEQLAIEEDMGMSVDTLEIYQEQLIRGASNV